jgi:pyridoxal 5'-phosphate synthase pdxT subunit
MNIGVLGLQGDFAAHGAALERIGCAWREVRRVADLDETDGLILPGGESTTMLKLIREEGFLEPLRSYAMSGKSMFGTCAGAILLAKEVTHPAQGSLGALDITVRRNGYGRQTDSFIAHATGRAFGDAPVEVVFIRAPIITRVGDDVETLLEQGGKAVLVRQGNVFAGTFHPELTDDVRVHRLFLDATRISKQQSA